MDAGIIDPNDSNWLKIQKVNPQYAAKLASGPVSSYLLKGDNAITGIWPGGVRGATLADRSDVYFHPSGRFSSGGLQPRTILHEALHSLTGLGDVGLAKS
jgi:hypothetical protein